MKVVPTLQALWSTLWLTLFAASVLTNIVAIYCWGVYEAKWDEVLETAEFNDLDGDGISNVIIHLDE